MAENIIMPRYGANMEEGMVGEWFFQEGDAVHEGQIICTIEIEKLTNELPAPVSGILRKIIAAAGDTAACGDMIGIIGEADEEIAEDASKQQAPEPERTPGSSRKARGKKDPGITPKALKLAQEIGVDWSSIAGSGSGYFGMVTRDDIKALQGSPAADVQSIPSETSGVSLSPSASRKVTARRMSESLRTAAQASIWMDGDITILMNQIHAAKAQWLKEGLKLTLTPLVLQAAARAVQDHPQCRTVMHADGSLELLERISIALAADTSQGLMVPVIHDAHAKSLKELAAESSKLYSRAESGGLSSDDMTGHCMTVTNLGMYGVTYMKPVLNLPESVILGVGTALQQVKVIDGGLYPRWVLPLSLTFDHRVVDGAPAARFLRDICRILEQGSDELQEVYQ